MMTSSVLMGVVMVMAMVGAQRPMQMSDDQGDLEYCGSVYQKSENEEERSQRICSQHAVCADVWDTVRDWMNGTRCRDYRIMYNCICPGGRECPIENPDHVLYANDKQSQYLCEPVCELEACRTGLRAAKEMIRPMSDRRSGLSYYRMNCRCADHHVPLPSRGNRGRLNRATRYWRVRFDRRNRLVKTQYKCVNFIENDDPCLFQ